MQIDMRTKSNAKTEDNGRREDDAKSLESELKKGKIPDDEDLQIKQIEAVIKRERQDGISYPFIFINGWMIKAGQDEGNSKSRPKMTPTDIIRAELKLREERRELNN